MKYWDASAVVSLVLRENQSERTGSILQADFPIVSWWGTPVECYSALLRRKREKLFSDLLWPQIRQRLEELLIGIDFIVPSKIVRDRAIRLLNIHPLRAGDALQLAAALQWCQEQTQGVGFVCLDDRLGKAASLEGFSVSP